VCSGSLERARVLSKQRESGATRWQLVCASDENLAFVAPRQTCCPNNVAGVVVYFSSQIQQPSALVLAGPASQRSRGSLLRRRAACLRELDDWHGTDVCSDLLLCRQGSVHRALVLLDPLTPLLHHRHERGRWRSTLMK
jgi:hypothetical protein